jgi:malonyl-CoA/methylmalonyl-CoA synthetase
MDSGSASDPDRPTPEDLRAWARHLGGGPHGLDGGGPDRREDGGAPVPVVPADLGALLDGLVVGDLPTAFARTAARVPDEPALAVDGPWVTHGELAHRAARTHAVLAARGVAPGERVLLCGTSSIELVTGYLGLLRAGAVVVLANPAYTAGELRHLVDDSGARLALADPEPGERLAGLVDVIRVDALPPVPAGTPEPPAAAPGPDAPALLAYTSGTTGAPKGVPLTHANLLSSIRAAMLAWRWSPSDVLVHALPLSHQHGLGGVHATLLAGSRAVVLSRFTPDGLAAAAERHRASVLFAVPAMYERLCADRANLVRVGRSLRLPVCGSAPLGADLAARVSEVLGSAPLERYGSTEAGLDVSLPVDGPGGPGTVGLPLPGVRLRLSDAGEVLLRGPQVFDGYWNDPEATAEAFVDGWFRTGDLGRREPDTGYLRLTGRLKELIISGGMNVSPREVELALEDHVEVAEVAVAGVASTRWGEEVTAWVVPAPGARPDEEELLAHAAHRLAAYKRPKRVYVVEELPRNGMGKVQRGRLRPPDPAVDDPVRPAAGADTTELDRARERLRRADPGPGPGGGSR